MSPPPAGDLVRNPRQNRTWLSSLIFEQSREYGPTFASEFVVLACQLLTYKLAAHLLGSLAFAEYALARRTISLLFPIPLLGLAVALPRFIARSVGSGGDSESSEYFAAAAWSVGVGSAVTLLLINSFPGTFAFIFFGSGTYRNLAFPLSVWLCGFTLHLLAYSFFRGHLAMLKANVLQLVNLGFIPLLTFVFFRESARQYLLALGSLTVAVAGATLVFLPWRRLDPVVRSRAKELLSYGLPRVPGEFFQMALFTLPATLAVHLDGIKPAGYVSLATSILNMIGSVFGPLGLILLPKASRMLAAGERRQLRTHVIDIIWLTTLVSAGLALFIGIFAKPLLRVCLGPGFDDATSVIRVMIMAALPFSFYCLARNLVDAYHTNAVNARNLLITFVGFVLLVSLGSIATQSISQILYTFLAAMTLLALLTGRETLLILRVDS